MNQGKFSRLENVITHFQRIVESILDIEIIISGSFALYLLGLLRPDREARDLDIVLDIHHMNRVLSLLHRNGVYFNQSFYELDNTESIYYQITLDGISIDLIFKSTEKLRFALTKDNDPQYDPLEEARLIYTIGRESQTIVTELNEGFYTQETSQFETESYSFITFISHPFEIMNAKRKMIEQNDVYASKLLSDSKFSSRGKVLKHLQDYIFARDEMNKKDNVDYFTIVNKGEDPIKISGKLVMEELTTNFSGAEVVDNTSDKGNRIS
jgi:hypothetical protein